MKFFLKKYYSTLFLWMMCFFSFSQTQEHRNSGFSKPMNLPFNLAGSFGEPRKDHFHSGIDIKTNGIEGELVFAVYDGYISRIRVSSFGYGRAIYITHTNGFTSVYGHLNRFNNEIEKYIHEQHYLLKKSELDLTFDATKFLIKQNDTIAFSGNTGGSSAPHLHFEIRDSKTEHALNPLDFYPSIFYIDTIKPQINKVKIYQFENYFHDSKANIFDLKKEGKLVTTVNPISINQNAKFNFSLEGFDKQDTSENKNGIKKIEVYQKDSLVFKYDLTEIDFDKTRMCNAFIDYDEMMNGNGYFYNCYQLKGKQLPIYHLANYSFFKLDSNNTQDSLSIICYDYNENKTAIKLVFKKEKINFSRPIKYKISQTDSSNDSILLHNIKLIFPKGCFYENAYLSIKEFPKDEKNISKIIQVNGVYELIPLHKPAKIEFKSSIKKVRNKIVVVRQDFKGKETALKTTFDKNKFYAETKELGSFYLKYDTTKPSIEIINYKLGIKNFDNNIAAKITDNLSGINTYNGYIDDKWTNFYYDAKNDLLQYNFDEYCTKGEHNLKIIVTDNVGNKSIVQQKFIY